MNTTLTWEHAHAQIEERRRVAAARTRADDACAPPARGPIRRLAARYWRGEHARHEQSAHRTSWRTRRV